jgi:hypothetical protein
MAEDKLAVGRITPLPNNTRFRQLSLAELNELRSRLERAERGRDALRAALDDVLGCLDPCSKDGARTLEVAAEALAKLEEKK